MITRIQTIRYTLRAVFFIAILLSVFYACENSTSSDSTDSSGNGGNGGHNGGNTNPLQVFDKWIAKNTANSLEAITTGTPVHTRAGLEQMTAGGEYHLTANIDLGAEDWTPLFSKNVPFTGTLHGNGYIIYNLNINAPEANYQGLFAALSGASIKNLGIGVGSIHTNAATGALAGHAKSSTTTHDITNIMVAGMAADSQIIVDGTVEDIAGNAFSYAGTLFGILESGYVSIFINEGVAVKATGNTDRHGRVGGIVGHNAGNIYKSSSSGAVSTNSGNYVGGLVGYNTNSGLVRGSSSGNVSSVSGNNVGGFAGHNIGIVQGSVSGNVSSGSGNNIGGFVGQTAHVAVNAVRGAVSGIVRAETGDSIGGVVGQTNNVGMEGYTTGWVMVATTNTNTNIGAAVGSTPEATAITSLRVYYHSKGGDHVGSIDDAPAVAIGAGNADEGDTGSRGTNGIGTGVDDITNAVTIINDFTKANEEGSWTFIEGEWPHINISEDITDYMDYTTSPAQPAGFVD